MVAHTNGADVMLLRRVNVQLPGKKLIHVSVKEDSVLSLKQALEIETGIPAGSQILLFNGRTMKDRHKLSEYHTSLPFDLQTVTEDLSKIPEASSSTERNTKRGSCGDLIRFTNTHSGIPISPDHTFSVTFREHLPLARFLQMTMEVHLKNNQPSASSSKSPLKSLKSLKRKARRCPGRLTVNQEQRR